MNYSLTCEARVADQIGKAFPDEEQKITDRFQGAVDSAANWDVKITFKLNEEEKKLVEDAIREEGIEPEFYTIVEVK